MNYIGFAMDNGYVEKHGTDKAFFVTVSDGSWNCNHPRTLWVPKSVCRISEPNDVGICEILIPLWIFTNARVDYYMVREMSARRRVFVDSDCSLSDVKIGY